MTLVDLQRRFHAAVTSAGETAFEGWDPALHSGLAVYRNAYRARLIDCLRSGFEKTWTWIGDESFDAAAAHHLIARPPRSWTLDDAGAGFEDTLAQLFPGDPEVADLAWLEWEMQQAFTAPDEHVLDAAGFAALSQDFTDETWASLRLSFRTGMRLRQVRTDCEAIWAAMTTDAEMPADILLGEAQTLVVWRQDLSPRFRMLGADEAAALETLQQGGTFGDMCAAMVERLGASGIEAAGRALGAWIAQGLMKEQESACRSSRLGSLSMQDEEERR